MNWIYYLYWLYCAVAASFIALASLYYIRFLYQHEYRVAPYCAWISDRFAKDWLMLALTGVIALMFKICNVFFINKFPTLAYICFYGADIIFLYLLSSNYLAYRKSSVDQPMPIKGTALRIFIFVWLAAFLCEANMMRETEYYGSVTWFQYLLPYFIGYLPAMILPLLTFLASVIIAPNKAFKKSTESESIGEPFEEIVEATEPKNDANIENQNNNTYKGEEK